MAISTSQRAYLLLVLATLCWGVNAVLARLAVDNVSPMVLVTLRWIGVVVVMLVFAREHLQRDWPALKARLGLVVAMGVLGFSGFNVLFYTAAKSTTAVNIGILQGSIPVFVLLGVLVIYRTRASLLQVVGVLVTMVGVTIVASAGSVERLLALRFNPGDVLMLGACALYAGYAVALRSRPPSSSLGLFTLLAIVALLAALPMLAVEAAYGQIQLPTLQGWVVILLATLLPSLLSQIAFIQAITLIGPSRAGVFVNLVPVFAALLAVVVLGEAFRGFHAAALVLVLAGIAIAERGKNPSE